MATNSHTLFLKAMQKARFTQYVPKFDAAIIGYNVVEVVFFYQIVSLSDGQFKRVVFGVYEPLEAIKKGFITRQECAELPERSVEDFDEFFAPFKFK